ncbi:Beta-ketoadipyl-CoA thiolase [Paraconexibacter sp. AEG42_29]|uniref:acetyl-CoA C-acyltransferase n=1 Tax=Paraconexibacter sp. AEG42_29 TaxID=2997339 RepID=A0AAU7B0I0_9ACTN
MTGAVIVEAVRTPIGRLGGALGDVRSDDLAANVLAAAVARSGVTPADIEDVVLGCANQAGEDNRDVARMAALLAGFPVAVGGVTVNRLCGSGLEAVAQASRAIAADVGEVYVAGGVESMTRAPLVMAKPPRAYDRGDRMVHDSALGWRFVNPRMESLGHTDPLGVTAENVARQHGISREEQDRFALASHTKALAAVDRLAAEIVPVGAGPDSVTADEGPRADTSLERLARLRPIFAPDGTVTAGNASPLNDGAAALVLTSANYAQTRGLEAKARVLGAAAAGVEPRVMGLGPVPAVHKLLGRLGLTLDDIDLIELNEAFAAQTIGVCRELDLDPEDARLNPNGGAIALGHPLGCSGARLVTTLVHELQRRPDARYGLATMCIGVGQGVALVVERL